MATDEHINLVYDTLNKEFKNDPLFRLICKRSELLDELFDDEICSVDLNRWYSTLEVADILKVNNATLRYYLDPLETYILPSDVPSGRKRLNYESVFRLKMIFLLKSELGVPGLEEVTGVKGKVIINSSTKETGLAADPMISELENKITMLSGMLHMMLETGLFKSIQEEVDGETRNKLIINSNVAKLMNGQADQLFLSGSSDIYNDLESIKQAIGESDKKYISKEDLENIINENELLRLKVESLDKDTKNADKSLTYIRMRNRFRDEAVKELGHLSIVKRALMGETKKEEFISDYISKKLKESGLEDNE